jgi:large subunit ribosomal protein L21
MYAIFQTGGKQYRVGPGETIRVEKIDGPVGDTVEFNQVLLIQADSGVQVGQPYVRGARVVARIVEQDRGRKIRVFKMRNRKTYRKQMGHRQWYTGLRIQEIQV